jgi:hypothetical protein
MTNRKRTVEEPDPLDREIDYRGGVRGKYAARYAEGTNIVLLEPDVAKKFPNSTAVNAALRKLIRTAPRRTKRKR